MISEDIWDEAFDGFHIYDCAIRNKNSYSFLCIQQMQMNGAVGVVEPSKRMINVFTDLDVILTMTIIPNSRCPSSPLRENRSCRPLWLE